jgi:hypothetical protein
MTELVVPIVAQLIRRHPSMSGLDPEVSQAIRSHSACIPRRRQDCILKTKRVRTSPAHGFLVCFLDPYLAHSRTEVLHIPGLRRQATWRRSCDRLNLLYCE